MISNPYETHALRCITANAGTQKELSAKEEKQNTRIGTFHYKFGIFIYHVHFGNNSLQTKKQPHLNSGMHNRLYVSTNIGLNAHIRWEYNITGYFQLVGGLSLNQTRHPSVHGQRIRGHNHSSKSIQAQRSILISELSAIHKMVHALSAVAVSKFPSDQSHFFHADLVLANQLVISEMKVEGRGTILHVVLVVVVAVRHGLEILQSIFARLVSMNGMMQAVKEPIVRMVQNEGLFVLCPIPA